MLSKCRYESPLGEMTLVAFDNQLCGVYFDDQKYFMAGFEGMEIAEQDSEILQVTKQWLDRYFSGAQPDLAQLPLAPQGTAFQKKIWAALAEIPYGQTITYGQLAEQLSCKSAQAIGSAVGKNSFSILVPCHRVLGAKGQLTGYAGGLERKRYLLELEKNHDFL